MAYYITGDTHRAFDRVEEFCESMETTQDDVLIILGDAGINFFLNSSDYQLKQELAELPITLFCIHGNHEERPYNVEGYEEQEWNGAIAYIDPRFPNQIFAKDGEIYDIDGKKVLVIGGAYSVDKVERLKCGSYWFESEQPTPEIKYDVKRALEQINWQIDVVLSHTCPYDYMPKHLFVQGIKQEFVDNSTEEWLQTIESKLKYNYWFFGHFHDFYEQGKLLMLYEDILDFEEITE